jgi:hypothetical protein
MKGQDAIIRIARKLLRRIRAVLLSERRYVIGIDECLTAREIGAPGLLQPQKKAQKNTSYHLTVERN